jgi:AcrR family transcriptional regulator
MPTAEAQVPPRRTRLTPEREQELYIAVIDLLREVGYEAMTMDAVAARTHSSKATLYRQWKGKPELVVAALRHTKPMEISHIDTGAFRGDLHELAREIAGAAKQDTAVIRALGQACHHNEELRYAMREHLIGPDRLAFDAVVGRAVARGELVAGHPALEFIPHMLLGALIGRELLDDRTVDVEYLSHYIDAVVLPALCSALTPPAPGGAPHQRGRYDDAFPEAGTDGEPLDPRRERQ